MAFIPFSPLPGGNSETVSRETTRSRNPYLTVSVAQNNNKQGKMGIITDALTGAAIDAGGRIIDAGANKIVDSISNGGSPKNGGSGGTGSNSGNSGSRSHSSGWSLTQKPNPKVIALDTGLKPNTMVSEYMQAEENVCSPVHITSCFIQIPTDTTNRMNQYFINQIVPDLQTRAQSNVNFFIDTVTLFSATNILTSLNSMFYAIQVYLFYMSIISHESLPSNHNDGMTYLRQQFTPQMIEDLTNLGRRLADIPIPPNALELMRYLSGNFLSGENQGSTLIKFCPHYLNGSTIIVSGEISAASAGITTSTNISIYNILRRCVPQWVPGQIYDVDPSPVFDQNFLTLFANAPHTMYATALSSHPQVATEDEAIAYNSYTNNLDGTAFGLATTWNTTSNKWIQGLMIPYGGLGNITTSNSRRSFYSVSGTKGYYVAKDYPFLVRSRPETYAYTSNTTTLSCHLPGASRCLSVSSNALRETDFNVLEFIIDVDSIAMDKKEMFNPYAKSSKAGRGPKLTGKPKSSKKKGKGRHYGKPLTDSEMNRAW